MPTPISISSSPSLKVGAPAAGTVHEESATPMLRVWPLTRSPRRFKRGEGGALFGRGADDFLNDQRSSDAATPGRIGRFLDRDIVVGDQRGDFADAHFPAISAPISKFMMSPS